MVYDHIISILELEKKLNQIYHLTFNNDQTIIFFICFSTHIYKEVSITEVTLTIQQHKPLDTKDC